MSAINADRLYQLIGQRIRERRESSDSFISQAQLADSLGLERTSITNIERGAQRAPLNVLYEICAKLELEITELLPQLAEVEKSAWSGEDVVVGKKSLKVSPKTAQFIEALKKRA